jgi:hypothetical protein
MPAVTIICVRWGAKCRDCRIGALRDILRGLNAVTKLDKQIFTSKVKKNQLELSYKLECTENQLNRVNKFYAQT